MPTLLLTFRINLSPGDNKRDHDGLFFHRWFPDGEKDALALATNVSHTTLKVWFERRGFGNRSIIRYHNTKEEVSAAVIPTVAVLVGNPLFGSLEIHELPEKAVTVLRENRIGDPIYEALGQRVVITVLYPAVARFIDTLRTKYGQYWIKELVEWDAKEATLGGYCYQILRLQWSLDQGATWADFIPNEASITMPSRRGTPKSFRAYLTEEDWNDLAQLSQETFTPPLAALLLARAYEMLDEENYKYALIEGVTALDIGLDRYERLLSKRPATQKTNRSKRKINVLGKSITQFARRWFSARENKGLESRLQAVASTLDLANKEKTIKLTIQAIKARNKAAHELYFPSEKDKSKIFALLQVVASLYFGSGYKLPSARLGNRTMSVESWEQHLYGQK